MKNLLYIIIPFMLAIGSCKEDNESPATADPTQLNNHITTCLYAPYTTGSTFTYEQETFSGTATATWTVGSDKVINNRQYIQVSGMLGVANTVYFNCENGEYTLRGENVPSVGTLELIYLKEGVPVNTAWSQTINQSYNGINYQTRYDFTYAGNETSRTVRGVSYPNVIHIHLDTYTNVTGSMQLFSQDDHYWAEGVGLIESIGTNVTFELISHNIL